MANINSTVEKAFKDYDLLAEDIKEQLSFDCYLTNVINTINKK